MRRLWIQLTLAFAFVTLSSVLVAAVLANRQASLDFRAYVARNQVQESGLVTQLQQFYQQNGSWDGVAAVFDDARPGYGPMSMGAGSGMMRGMPALMLIDAQGGVVYDTNGKNGRFVDEANTVAVPVTVGSRVVGTLMVYAGASAILTAAAEGFLAQINGALLQAGVIAVVLGALLGFVLARRLAAPLDQLARAAHALAAGDLSQRVATGGITEVAAAGAAFNEMAAELGRSEALRRRMVADIAHELRTPIAVIQGNLQAILDDVYPLDKRELETLLQETHLLSHVVDDLRDLAMAEAGQLRLEFQDVDLGKLAHESVAQFGSVAAEKGITLSVHTQSSLADVRADPARVRQVLQNLLANAIRYTQAGSIDVEVLAADGGMLEVAVRDSGSGIAAEDLPHVFDRFWRADRARTRTQGGSGLGLAIARQFVELQGGMIGAQSEPGRGSRFWFRLPVARNHIGSAANVEQQRLVQPGRV